MAEHKYLSFFFLLIVIYSCQKKDLLKNKDALLDSIKIENKIGIRNIGETLLPASKKKIKNWKEYQQLDDLLNNFYSISPTEALNLSKELSTATQQLKDSINIERFKEPDISIRINVLNNYALRLNDMSSISAIGPTEVNQEIQNILDAFSALNAKINNISKQEKLETEVKEIEIK